MSRNSPHHSAAFEGYYSKFDLSAGGSIALIICSVRNASESSKPHMVSFTSYPARGAEIWQQQFWDKQIIMQSLGREGDFELKIPGIGAVTYLHDGTTNYDLDFDDFTFRAKTGPSTSWTANRPSKETSPEGWLSYLPLPLHWHVSSLRSECRYDFTTAPSSIPDIASSGTAIVHQEKNWGSSFPKGHIWIQARDGERGICLAGGEILGLQAYLVGYRSAELDLDFKPPFALQVLGYSPFMTTKIDWRTRTVSLDVQSFTRRLVITAKAPRDSFFALGGPFSEGHRENALTQSFRATVEVTIFKRQMVFSGWEEVRTEVFEGASLEFGAEYYGARTKTD